MTSCRAANDPCGSERNPDERTQSPSRPANQTGGLQAIGGVPSAKPGDFEIGRPMLHQLAGGEACGAIVAGNFLAGIDGGRAAEKRPADNSLGTLRCGFRCGFSRELPCD